MEDAKSKSTEELLAAVRRNWRLWTIFQASLVDSGCTVPTPVRANLLGLANFIDRHIGQLLLKPDPAKVDVLVNINRQIGEGLLEGQRAAAAKAAASEPAPAPAPSSSPQLRESA